MPSPENRFSEHKKDKRPSTKTKLEKGQRRKANDRTGYKG
jgi:hypothetical protein